jgi:hypothetical protein
MPFIMFLNRVPEFTFLLFYEIMEQAEITLLPQLLNHRQMAILRRHRHCLTLKEGFL